MLLPSMQRWLIGLLALFQLSVCWGDVTLQGYIQTSGFLLSESAPSTASQGFEVQLRSNVWNIRLDGGVTRFTFPEAELATLIGQVENLTGSGYEANPERNHFPIAPALKETLQKGSYSLFSYLEAGTDGTNIFLFKKHTADQLKMLNAAAADSRLAVDDRTVYPGSASILPYKVPFMEGDPLLPMIWFAYCTRGQFKEGLETVPPVYALPREYPTLWHAGATNNQAYVRLFPNSRMPQSTDFLRGPLMVFRDRHSQILRLPYDDRYKDHFTNLTYKTIRPLEVAGLGTIPKEASFEMAAVVKNEIKKFKEVRLVITNTMNQASKASFLPQLPGKMRIRDSRLVNLGTNANAASLKELNYVSDHWNDLSYLDPRVQNLVKRADSFSIDQKKFLKKSNLVSIFFLTTTLVVIVLYLANLTRKKPTL